MVFNGGKNREKMSWKLGDSNIDEVEETTHIGLTRNSNLKNSIGDRIQKGRRCMYGLLGAGLHGKNGVNPIVSHKLYTTFSRPRIIYGLEVLNLLEGEKAELDRYERKFLKQIQGLPDRCPSVAVYTLLGTTPITAHIEKNALTTFFNIASHPEFMEHTIARRQLVMKDESSHSWFVTIRLILQKYSLPTAFELMNNPPKKSRWKSMLDKAFRHFWEEKWNTEILEKPSLRYLSVQKEASKTPHNVWKAAQHDTRAISKSAIKVRLLTGTYTLQSNRKKFNQHTVSEICLLCNTQAEDRLHFILKCPTLHTNRQKHLNTLQNMLAMRVSIEIAGQIFDDENLLLQCILDCSHPIISNLIGDYDVLDDIEEISRNLIFDLHTDRAVNLGNSYSK